jgi:tight adherence protein C
VILGVIAGAGVAAGLLLLVAGLRPAPAPLARVLADYDAARSGTRPQLTAAGQSWSARWERAVGRPLAEGFLSRGWLSPTVRADLSVLGRTPGEFFAAKATGAVVGLVIPALAIGAAGAAGMTVPVLVPAWVSLAGAVVGFLIPDLRLRARATQVRRDFRVATGAYLDLVAMRMASGAGLAEALIEAAQLGGGPAFARLRGALADARTDGFAPAAALGRLGEELALPDLVDTAARLSLVDTSGAQAEASLRAQAASLRDRELTDLQGASAERSQSMLVAQVVLGFGFLLFLGYPAVAKVLAI